MASPKLFSNFQICIFMLMKVGNNVSFQMPERIYSNEIFFQTINDGLSQLIPIHSCSKWKTNWPISKKCSEAKICRWHIQNQPYLEKCLCYKHDLGVILKLRFEVVHLILKVENVTNDPCSGFCQRGSHIFSPSCITVLYQLILTLSKYTSTPAGANFLMVASKSVTVL